MTTDDVKDLRQRRRGSGLVKAIHEAARAELVEVGFRGLTIERIAERAGSGRMSLYRRWNSVEELVLDALINAAPDTAESIDTGDLRTDLLTLFRHIVEQRLSGEFAAALGAVMSVRGAYPELVAKVRDSLLTPDLEEVANIARRAAERGEIGQGVITSEACAAGPALVVMRSLAHGQPPSEEELETIVDRVAVPVLRAV